MTPLLSRLDPRRRAADKPFAQWRHWVIIGLVAAVCYLAGLLTYARTHEELRAIITSFFGGVVAVMITYGGLAGQVWKNLEKVNETRGERIGELEDKVTAQQERIGELEKLALAERADCDKKIAETKENFTHQLNDLRNQLSIIRAHYQAAIEEKAALQVSLAKALAEKNAQPHRHVAKRVLVVDDDEGIRESMFFLLKSAGYDVTASENAVAALHTIESGNQFDLIIIDLSMPNLSGDELADILQKLGTSHTAKLVFYTGVDSVTAQEIGARLRIPVWQKPLRGSELIANLRGLLEG